MIRENTDHQDLKVEKLKINLLSAFLKYSKIMYFLFTNYFKILKLLLET